MTDLKLILEQINQTLSSLPDWNNLSDFVGEFHQIWLKLGNLVQQELVQSKIEEKEAEYESPRTKREKKYYTPLGEMVVKRRVYATADGLNYMGAALLRRWRIGQTIISFGGELIKH